MDGDNTHDLNLGLSLGQSSSKPKDKSENSSNTRSEEGDRSNKLINDFKNFLEGGTLKPECSTVSQRSDQAKLDHSFCNNFPNSAADGTASKSLNGKGLWDTNDNRAAEALEDKRSGSSNKRKNLFDEMSNQKKREGDSHDTDLHESSRPSHISVNTDDGSTGDYEDVADSEVVGSTSRLDPHNDDVTRKYNRAGSHPESQKEVYTVVDSSMVEAQSQRRFTISSEKDFKVGKMPYSVPFPPQSVNILNLPYPIPVKDCNPVTVSSTAGYSQPGIVQVITPTSNDRSGTPILPGSLPVMFGYSPVQLPVLDKDTSNGLAFHTQLVHPPYAGRAQQNPDKSNDGLKLPQVSYKPSESPHLSGMASEQGKGDASRQQNNGGDVASSSHTTEDVVGKGRSMAAGIGAKDESELSTIRPGLAADIKFGGCGSYPNLPWVSTKGPGPNGRTISGVTYKFSPTQIKIVCACHGSHMSPEEFVRHAAAASGGDEQPENPDPCSALASMSAGNNPATTSAQS